MRKTEPRLPVIEPFRDMRKVREAVEQGPASHWFANGSSIWHRTRVHDALYRGAFFVTSDLIGPETRRYSVRRVHSFGRGGATVETVSGPDPERTGLHGGWRSYRAVHVAARKMADGCAEGMACPCQRCTGDESPIGLVADVGRTTEWCLATFGGSHTDWCGNSLDGWAVAWQDNGDGLMARARMIERFGSAWCGIYPARSGYDMIRKYGLRLLPADRIPPMRTDLDPDQLRFVHRIIDGDDGSWKCPVADCDGTVFDNVCGKHGYVLAPSESRCHICHVAYGH